MQDFDLLFSRYQHAFRKSNHSTNKYMHELLHLFCQSKDKLYLYIWFSRFDTKIEKKDKICSFIMNVSHMLIYGGFHFITKLSSNATSFFVQVYPTCYTKKSFCLNNLFSQS